MGKKRRKRYRNKCRNMVFICFVSFGLLFLLSYGYASFSTKVQVDVTGNAKKLYISDKIKKLAAKDNVTMMTDPFGNIRYTGPNDGVHNYICLTSETPCQDKHLFRIIGSFINTDDGNGKLEPRVKVVKATEYSRDYWDTSGSNNWARPSSLNTTLNTTYYYNLDSTAQNLIGNAVWNLGGIPINDSNLVSSKLYDYEHGANTSAPLVWVGKISLIYPSDYTYSSSFCGKDLRTIFEYNDSNCIDTNWLYFNKSQWFLSPSLSSFNGSWFASVNGNPIMSGSSNLVSYQLFYVYPSFYLKSNTLLITKNHDGTLLNPYVVKLDG